MASFERASLSSARARVLYLPTLNEPYVSFTFADHDQDISASGLPPLVLSFTATGRARKPPGQKAEDRPDLVARVFNAKLRELLDDLIKKKVLSKVAAHLHVIEYQHRGLPHAHILLILDKESRLKTVDDIDSCVSAEFPEEPERADYEAGEGVMWA